MKGNVWYHLTLSHPFRSWQKLSSNWIISIVNRFVLLLFVISVLMIVWRWKILPSQIPLWYSRPWGAEQLAHPVWLFLLPLGSIFWYVVNSLLAVYVVGEYLVFTQTLFLTSLVTHLLSFITLVKILFLIS